MVPLSFGSHDFLALDGALFWPAHRALIVADLHLEKASFYAGFGQMLPPYDSRETVARLIEAAARSGAEAVWCLGDNYHDDAGEDRLDPHAAGALAALAARVDLVWIAGNHDPAVRGRWGGRMLPEHQVGGIWLRHDAAPDDRLAICGHYHPKLRLGGRGGGQRCFVRSESRVILPAFGALTGGLDCSHPAIAAAMQGPCEALIPAAGRLLRFPIGAPMAAPRADMPRRRSRTA